MDIWASVTRYYNILFWLTYKKKIKLYTYMSRKGNKNNNKVFFQIIVDNLQIFCNYIQHLYEQPCTYIITKCENIPEGYTPWNGNIHL